MIAFIIIAIIAAVIIIISLIPISCGVYFRWHESETEFDLVLKYGFIRIKLPQRGEKPETEDKPNETGQKPEKEKKRPDTGRIISFVWDERVAIKRMIAAVLGYILKHAVKIKRLKIKLVLGVEDAMHTALIYGAANAVVFNAVGLMDKHMRLGRHSIDLKPAFNEPHIYTEDEAVTSTCIFNILAIAAVALRHAVPLLLRFRRMMKNGKSD